MADGRYRSLGGADGAVRRFVIEYVEATTLRIDCPKVINLDLEFARFLRAFEVEPGFAEEAAVEQRALVRRKIIEQIARWTEQGLTAPVALVLDNDQVVVSWRHDEFEGHSGSSGPDLNYLEVYDWVGTLSNRDFLLPCVCYLKALGCSPIYVTDGSRDEGVDCVGLVSSGGLRSTAVFVQARSRTDLVPGDVVLQESGKYASLPRTRRYLEYLDALGTGRRRDGAAAVYMMLTNSDFKHAAQENALKLGVLLRSRRQIAHLLSSKSTARRLADAQATLRIPAACDLTTDLSGLIDL